MAGLTLRRAPLIRIRGGESDADGGVDMGQTPAAANDDGARADEGVSPAPFSGEEGRERDKNEYAASPMSGADEREPMGRSMSRDRCVCLCLDLH